MSRLMTGAGEPVTGWRDEQWAQKAGTPGMAERMRRISAVTLLTGDADSVSDGLYPELAVLREAPAAGDLAHEDAYTHRETAIQYLEDCKRSIKAGMDGISTIADTMVEIAHAIAAWPRETAGQEESRR